MYCLSKNHFNFVLIYLVHYCPAFPSRKLGVAYTNLLSSAFTTTLWGRLDSEGMTPTSKLCWTCVHSRVTMNWGLIKWQYVLMPEYRFYLVGTWNLQYERMKTFDFGYSSSTSYVPFLFPWQKFTHDFYQQQPCSLWSSTLTMLSQILKVPFWVFPATPKFCLST